MRVAVTGGAGFIGSHLAEALAARGAELLVIDDLSSGKETQVPKGAHFERADVRGPKAALAIEGWKPEAVFHLGAQMDVRRSVREPAFDAHVNVVGTVTIAEAARRAGARQIVFSSTGGAIYGEQQAFPAGEDHPARAESPYGVAKFCAEQYLGWFARAGGPRAALMRFANVYGPRQDPHGEAGVVAIFAGRMLRGETPTIYGDGGQTRDFVYVGDVVRACVLAFEKGAEGPFNVGTGVETDVNELAARMARLAGYAGAIAHAEARAGEQRRSVISPAKAGAVLGWRPEVALDDGLRATLDWFRARG